MTDVSVIRTSPAYLRICAAAAVVFIVGCGAPAGPEVDDPSSSTETTDKILLNGLLLDAPALAGLSDAPLTMGAPDGGATGRLQLNTAASAGIERTRAGIDLLEYVARCALPPDASLVFDVGGYDVDYPGRLGLAPEWATEACDAECQGWVTACLLSHANLRGESVEISLRGSHPSLQPTQTELEQFPLQEAAFYGNVFAGGDEFDILFDMFACLGQGIVDSGLDEGSGDIDEYLHGRVCGTGACDIISTGTCTLPFPDHELSVCNYDAGNRGYTLCGDGFLDGAVFDQVITVYLRGHAPGG